MIEVVKKPVKWLRRAGRIRSLRNELPAITRQRLAKDLRSLGVCSGSVLLVHSSLKAIGYVEGGPDAVVDSLLDVLGPDGTLLMPSYPMNTSMYRYLLEKPVFDPRRTPSRQGTITETFRRRPGVVRSLHPTHSITAIGPLATMVTEGHERSSTPCGQSSPFAKLIDVGGQILCIGCGISKVTSYHVVEDRVKNFPLKVYLSEKMVARYIGSDGEEHSVLLYVHAPEIARLRIDHDNPQKEAEVREQLIARGIAEQGAIGEALSFLIDARQLETFLEKGIQRNFTIYVQSQP